MQTNKKTAQSEDTRRRLVRIARRFFGKRGFADTGTETIVEAANVTRGALYYHFSDKNALFETVVEGIAVEILAAIEVAARKEPTTLDGLIAGCRAYLDICLTPSVRRVFLVDAPSVLGPARMREIDAKYALGSLREGVSAVLADTRSTLSADALTALLSGALDEGVLWLMQNDDPQSRRSFDETLEAMIRRTLGRAG